MINHVIILSNKMHCSNATLPVLCDEVPKRKKSIYNTVIQTLTKLENLSSEKRGNNPKGWFEGLQGTPPGITEGNPGKSPLSYFLF